MEPTNLERVNLRRNLVAVNRFLTEALQKKLFVDNKIDELEIFQRPHVQERIKEYGDYLHNLLDTAQASRLLVDYTDFQEHGLVVGWNQKRNGVLVVKWADGSESIQVEYKHKPRRKTRMIAKRMLKTTVGFSVAIKPVVPAEHITLNMTLTKDGAEFNG